MHAIFLKKNTHYPALIIAIDKTYKEHSQNSLEAWMVLEGGK